MAGCSRPAIGDWVKARGSKSTRWTDANVASTVAVIAQAADAAAEIISFASTWTELPFVFAHAQIW